MRLMYKSKNRENEQDLFGAILLVTESQIRKEGAAPKSHISNGSSAKTAAHTKNGYSVKV